MNKYGAKAQQTIEKTMQEFSAGKLRSGPSGQKVTDRKQAVAIGISKARDQHQKTPTKKAWGEQQ